MMKVLVTVSGLVFAIFFTACSTAKTYQNRTGFLTSYESMMKVPGSNSLYFETMADSNLSAYEKILIPDIIVLSNTPTSTPSENSLYTLVTAYTSAAYRKNIIMSSSNYDVVDVAQKDAIVMQIALSMIEVHPEDKHWDKLSALPFSLNASTYAAYQEGNVRLLVEVKITDAMDGRVLARSILAVEDEKIILHDPGRLQFKDIQAALDKWLNESVIKH